MAFGNTSIGKPDNSDLPPPRSNPLTDDSRMTFGKFKGVKMSEVPANYLHWLWTNGKKDDKVCPVADYIRRNLHALSLEHPDGIWD